MFTTISFESYFLVFSWTSLDFIGFFANTWSRTSKRIVNHLACNPGEKIIKSSIEERCTVRRPAIAFLFSNTFTVLKHMACRTNISTYYQMQIMSAKGYVKVFSVPSNISLLRSYLNSRGVNSREFYRFFRHNSAPSRS